MEYFDVVDASGNPTGITKPRAEVHRDGDWHRSVHAWLLNRDNELLIQRRALNKDTNPGLWDVSVAGHLSAGETSLQAIVKEAREELGLHVTDDAFEYLFTVTQQARYPDTQVLDNELQDVYLLRADVDIAEFVIQTEEVAELRYISIKQLEQMVAEGSAEFVQHDEEFHRLFHMLRQ